MCARRSPKGGPVRRHEVATPLADVLDAEDARLLDELVAARRWDVYRDAFEDADHFARYLDQTSGNLTWVAARRLGAADEAVIRDAAYGAGVAAWLLAIPELEAAGRVPLLDGTAEGVRALALGAQQRLKGARTRRGAVPKPARAALLHVGQADAVLKTAIRDPSAVAEGRLPTADPGLAWRALTGRW